MCAVAHIRTREFLPLMYLAYHHTYTSFVMRRKYFSFEVTHKENQVLMLALVPSLLLFFLQKNSTDANARKRTHTHLYEYTDTTLPLWIPLICFLVVIFQLRDGMDHPGRTLVAISDLDCPPIQCAASPARIWPENCPSRLTANRLH